MERGEQGNPDAPANTPAQHAEGQHAEGQHAEGQQPRAEQTPQAALAAVTRGDTTPPAPPAPPKTDATPRPVTTLTEKSPYDEATTSGHGSSPLRDKGDPYRQSGVPGPPRRARSRDEHGLYRSVENMVPLSRRRGSGLDWIVPVNGENKPYVPRQRTVGERLQPTLDHAHREKTKYARKALLNGYILNMAIGLQVLLGALVTGLAAAVSPSKVGVTTSVLGGLSTLVASYLARMRGSNEPELSNVRTKDLQQFIRECDAFQMDRGHITGPSEDQALEGFRRRFEELLGNANGERKLSPA